MKKPKNKKTARLLKGYHPSKPFQVFIYALIFIIFIVIIYQILILIDDRNDNQNKLRLEGLYSEIEIPNDLVFRSRYWQDGNSLGTLQQWSYTYSSSLPEEEIKTVLERAFKEAGYKITPYDIPVKAEDNVQLYVWIFSRSRSDLSVNDDRDSELAPARVVIDVRNLQ